MEYEDYTEYDFLEDEFFVRWVRNYDKETNQFWQQWIQDHPEKLETVLIAKQTIQSLGYKQKHKLSREEKEDMFNHIRKKNRHVINQAPRSRNSSVFIRVAAVLVIIMIATFSYYHLSNRENADAEVISYISKVNPAGRKTTFKLSDGTRIKLNASSTIKYPKNFAPDSRIVYLEGEAFFEVTRDENRPFLVVTEGITTKVLGTSFYVKNDLQQKDIQVALVSGKVSVLDEGGNTIMLAPNEMVTYSHNTIAKGSFDRDLVFGWVDNKLIFHKEDAAEVVKQLEKWYGVQFVMEKEQMFEGLFSGVFENESLENVLKGIRYGSEFSFTYEIMGQQVIIKDN
ncbi:FecR domain-containing protein [Fulvivirgaceae bacterium BMA12]|uniref:FecR domain-containing protein n=1 Tax=Agaribacillus aureus TaxID=3051825 RepID=A0ABT8L4J6_9BACT|nr:FecR domain-containing protein [Fulvivirgaceae bacterium BMA12]